MHNISFLALADQGRNAWWRYVLGTVLILLVWIIASGLIIIPLVSGAVAPDSPLGLALLLLSFAPMLLMTLLVNRWLHQRPAATLFRPDGRLNWRRIGLGAALWAALAGVAVAVEAILYPGRYALNTALVENLPLLLVGLLLIPLQTSAEEVFVRGYLLQATGRLTRNPLLLSVINGALFTLPHLANPEAAGQLLAAALVWFTFGVLFTLVTLRSGSLDYALGMHAGNNLFSFAIAGYESGALPASSLFIASELDAVYAFVSLAAAALAAYWIFQRLESRRLAAP
ncbi:MAG: lysostaphin resistance A-like protein [Chloroflexaceae bacterium]